MALNVREKHWSLFCIVGLLFHNTPVFGNENEMLTSTGSSQFNCSNGDLLSMQICLPKNYQNIVAPNEKTVVFTDFNYANFREVDDEKMIITFDVLITYFWRDNRIKKSFSVGVEPVSEEHRNRIWKPRPYIANLKSYHQRSTENKLRLEQLSVFNSRKISSSFGYTFSESQALVSYRVETQIKLYCNFMFESYPMDTQTCIFSLGSSELDTDRNVAFTLWMKGCLLYTSDAADE